MTTTPTDRARAPVVSTTALTRDYGDGAGVFDIALKVPRGSVFGLVGPNGAGKTTLLSLLVGTRRPDRGHVALGTDRHRVAVCPDVPDFDPWLTAREVVGFSARLQRVRADAGLVDEALRRVGLAEAAHRRNRGFSRGMRLRLGLAAALVGGPELVVLDEPASGLDPQGRKEILDLVDGLRGERTVILSSHLLADVERVCDEVGVLREGRLVYQGPVRDLLDHHVRPAWHVWSRGAAERVADLLAAEPWVVRAVTTDADCVYLEAESAEAGEYGVPRVFAAAGLPLVGMAAHAADLESAFLSLTRSEH